MGQIMNKNADISLILFRYRFVQLFDCEPEPLPPAPPRVNCRARLAAAHPVMSPRSTEVWDYTDPSAPRQDPGLNGTNSFSKRQPVLTFPSANLPEEVVSVHRVSREIRRKSFAKHNSVPGKPPRSFRRSGASTEQMGHLDQVLFFRTRATV